jgi:putative phosphoesterase
MRLAMFSDIHGNPIALEAVLEDIAARGGVDGYCILGDLVAIGYDPRGVLERLAALPNSLFVRGNTDRYVVTGQRPYPSLADAEADPFLSPRLVEVAHSFAWTQGYVSATGWFDWLARLPLEVRLELPGGLRMACVHVAPGEDDGAGLHPMLSDAELSEHVRQVSADLIVAGHTHRPMDRSVDGIRVLNVGSVSNPHVGDRRACYSILEATESGYTIEQFRVAYDYQSVIDAIQRSRHPAGEFIARHFVP